MSIKNIYKKKTIAFFILFFSLFFIASCNNSTYTDLDELSQFLSETEQNYPEIAKKELVGFSTLTKRIEAIALSKNPASVEMEPRIRLIGTIHGNEILSGEILIKFIKYLTENYGYNERITNILDNTYIEIIPIANPDGFDIGTRYNANYIDLNRNFSYHWLGDVATHGDYPFSEKESYAIETFSLNKVFQLSASFHTGSVVVNMPFDYATDEESAPLEYNLVKYFANKYTTSGSFIDNEDLLGGTDVYNGYINGGDWYVVNGSLQDWSYAKTGCLDLTIEISKTKGPPDSLDQVDEVFEYNREALLSYIESSTIGVYGKIVNGSGVAIPDYRVGVASGDLNTFSDSMGYYHKLLLPGSYTLYVYDKNNNQVYSKSIDITSSSPSIRLDISL